MKKTLLFGLLALVVFASSCKRTVEGEQNRWKSNMELINKLSAKYSNFKPALNEIKEQAEAKWSQAESISNQDEQIKAMAAANSVISSSFVGKMDRIESMMRSIEDKKTEVAQQGNDQNDREAARTAKNSADRAIRDARSQLSSAAVSSAAAANGVVDDIIRNLESAEKRLESVVSTAKEKENEQKKAEKDQKAADEQAKAEEEKKKSPIKCEYCGQMNDPGSKECGKCGAPISQK